MQTHRFYIDGHWVEPAGTSVRDVINPATEQACASIALGNAEDVDRAVMAARRAFAAWGASAPAERLALLENLSASYKRRLGDIAKAISLEMGAPISMAMAMQAPVGLGHLKGFIEAMRRTHWEQPIDPTNPANQILLEPIGVAALITPWNWPMNQVVLKVGAAFAAGCTVVLKPSEIAPLSSLIFAEVVEEAGLPKGVFNLVNGDGPTVGEALASHPEVDVVSLTGSNRAGVAVSKAAAATVKRVSLELGGKGPNLVFADADLRKAVEARTRHVFRNSGQSCNAPTRMLVERGVYDEAVGLAAAVAEATKVGDPATEGNHIGPVVSAAQFERVQRLIASGIEEGARLVAGGPGRPQGFNCGYYVRPTVFADVRNTMAIAREEIFGPVLAIIPFETEDEAVAIANDTSYGLTAYLQTASRERAHRVARKLRSGMVQINGAELPFGSPFGGYKQSGNGREGGLWGIHEFLEVKAVSGW